MNVTNIGFPFAAPASQGGAADAMAGTGFAGLLGAAPGGGMMTAAGMPSPFAAGAPSLPAAAQTGEALLPATIDSGSVNAPVPAHRPQVAMAQLLATAAPVAGTAPVVAGGNPLADAVAKALAKPAANDAGTEPVPVDIPAAPSVVPEPAPVASLASGTGTLAAPSVVPNTASVAPLAPGTGTSATVEAPEGAVSVKRDALPEAPGTDASVETDPTVAAGDGTTIATDGTPVFGKTAKPVPAPDLQAPVIATDASPVFGKTAKPVPARGLQAPANGTPQPMPQQDQPDATVALATPEVQTPLEQPSLPRNASPSRSAARQDRAVAAAATDPALPVNPAALDQTAVPVQPLAVPQAAAQIAAPDTPAPETPDTTHKAATAVSARSARIEAAVGSDGTMATGGAETTADLARAVAGKAAGGNAEGHAKGEDGQPAFAQQLASAETHHAAGMPLATGTVSAPSATTPVAAAPATPSTAASEPVLNAHPGELGRTLGVEIARKVDAGEDMLRVRLNPAELGRVEVTLAFDDKGNMQATMRADSQHTLDLLRQDAPDLGRALDQAGIRADTGSFRFESRDGGTGGNAGGQSAFQQQSRGGNQQFQDEPDLQSAAYRPVRSDGQVDLIA